jgi:hypothetical protein
MIMDKYTGKTILSTDDYLNGMDDCKAGIPHKEGRSKDYDRGYAAQYAHGQNLTEISQQEDLKK